MSRLDDVTTLFVRQCKDILSDALTGVYLHGSAAMGCFNEAVSDIDLLVVVEEDISDAVKRRLMDMIVALNDLAPKKGIEISVLRRDACSPFVYPTPFLLHFSVAHQKWYADDPEGYIEKMKGIDRDLAAHVTVLQHRGKCLFGAAIDEVFGPVDPAHYIDSIWYDIESAREDIISDPTYVTLNLCRTLAFLEDGLVLSKREGGQWGLDRVPEEYRALVARALEDYASKAPSAWSMDCAPAFAAHMLSAIRSFRHV